jgi:outer membrane cobalamin receptor
LPSAEFLIARAPQEAFICTMKTLLVALLAGAFAAGAQAGDSESGPRTLVVRKVKSKTVTGSNIARPVNRVGNTYDTMQTVHVIDSRAIEQSGATSLAGVLRRYPSIGIR